VSLQNKFKFKKAVIKDESGGMEDEGDDMGDEMEGNADIADIANAGGASDDEIDDFVGEFGQDKNNDAENLQNQIIQSSISREEWMLEVERVAHKLKINTQAGDGGKEWRAHLDQTKKYADQVKNSLPDVRVKLEKLSDEVSKALERISKKEGLLSKSFQGMTGDYRAHSDKLRDIQQSFTTVSKNVGDMENELADINERLSSIEKKIDDTGKSFSDTSPLQKIKKAIAQVKNDIKTIDIRIGVVSNTLLQLKLKERAK
jgi:estrogen-related receptor beta like 1